jgi:hypothetical protein
MVTDDDRPLAIVDIDGVVADVRHRLHHVEHRPKDWDAFFAAAVDDPPHAEGIAVVHRLADDHEIVFLTGRPRWLRAETEAWLEANGIGGHRVVMRPRNDRRPAAQVKLELVKELSAGRRLDVVVDDDPAVVDALRAAGLPVFAADWERRTDDEEATLQDAQEVAGET